MTKREILVAMAEGKVFVDEDGDLLRVSDGGEVQWKDTSYDSPDWNSWSGWLPSNLKPYESPAAQALETAKGLERHIKPGGSAQWNKLITALEALEKSLTP